MRTNEMKEVVKKLNWAALCFKLDMIAIVITLLILISSWASNRLWFENKIEKTDNMWNAKFAMCNQIQTNVEQIAFDISENIVTVANDLNYVIATQKKQKNKITELEARIKYIECRIDKEEK